MKIINTIKFDHCSLQKSIYPCDLYMKPHFDQEAKVSIILDGFLHEKTSQTHVQAGKGSLVIKPNDIEHENLFISKQTTILSLSFTKDYPLPPILKKWIWIEHPKISFLASRLWYSLKSVKNDAQLNQHLKQFVNTLKEIQNNQDRPVPQWLKNLKSHLDTSDNSMNKIGELSRNINLHRGYVSRVFKKYYSVSPAIYRNYVRLNHLMFSLSSPDKSLVEIAYECGFSDQSHMSRIIHKETGKTAKGFKTLAQIF